MAKQKLSRFGASDRHHPRRGGRAFGDTEYRPALHAPVKFRLSAAMIKWTHIISSTVLFGTGAGIAFFFLRAQRTGDARIIATVGRDVVLADLVFTATAVVVQPVTGVTMALMAGYPLSTGSPSTLLHTNRNA
jgi:hypothetical protein